MKKWIIIGVIIAVVAVASIGGVGYVVSRRALSRPDLVKSMKQVAGASGGVWHATWSPDGLKILYECGGLFTVDADGTNQAYLGEGDYPVWNPDGAKIAFVTDDGLEVVNADGGGRMLLADLAEIAPLATERQSNATAWSPDGGLVAFEVTAFVPDPSVPGKNADTSINGIWIVNADGTGLRQLARGLGENSCLVWGPDSQSIAFVSYGSDGKEDVWVSRLDGSDPRQLTASNSLEFDLSWSPDGSKLAFASRGWPDETERAIWVVDADGGSEKQLTEGLGRPSHPSWSPDGAMLAFCCGSGSTGDIWIMNADGSGKTRLTNTSVSRASTWFTCSRTLIRYREPQWSPDGTRLLFLNSLTKETDESWGVIQGESSGYDRLWVMELDREKCLD